MHRPADLKGMRIRVLPSEVQARTFELLGAVPMPMDLTEAIAAIKAGTIDAQENPLTNTVTYGVHKFHRFHTLSNHFYISRPIFLHRDAFDAWPADLQQRDARGGDGGRRVPARAARPRRKRRRGRRSSAQGCAMVELTAAEHDAFAAAVKPLLDEAQTTYGRELFDLVAARAR